MKQVEVRGAQPLREGVCRVIAEAGANHNNSVDTAVRLVEEAAGAGAWAIKFQMYKADRLAAVDSPKYWTDSIGTTSQYEAFKLSDQLPYGAWAEVAQAARQSDIVFFSTPFDMEAVAALEAIAVPLYKIASADITHEPLLREVAATGKPMLVSTGAATLDEIERAIEWIGYGPDRLVLLACTLTYPTPDEDGSFARIEYLRQHVGPYLVGSSDHTLGTAGAWMASALGAVCIEKHYTLDNDMPDVPDHAMSVTPTQLAEMVGICDRASLLRGMPVLEVLASERPARELARRSIVAGVDIAAGVEVTEDMLDYRRPGTGIPPADARVVIGSTALVHIDEGTTLQKSMLSDVGD